MEELRKHVSRLNGKKECEVRKLAKVAEGGFNRIFEFSMSDDTSLLVRIPYPSTLSKRFAVASEVATIAYVNDIGIPTPNVLDYSITSDNSIGTEYIVMEKVRGETVGDSWYQLSDKNRLKLLFRIVELERKLFIARLPASGSIYFKRDLPSDVTRIDIPGSEDLCVGPYAALRWWTGERTSMCFDRGPR